MTERTQSSKAFRSRPRKNTPAEVISSSMPQHFSRGLCRTSNTGTPPVMPALVLWFPFFTCFFTTIIRARTHLPFSVDLDSRPASQSQIRSLIQPQLHRHNAEHQPPALCSKYQTPPPLEAAKIAAFASQAFPLRH